MFAQQSLRQRAAAHRYARFGLLQRLLRPSPKCCAQRYAQGPRLFTAPMSTASEVLQTLGKDLMDPFQNLNPTQLLDMQWLQHNTEKLRKLDHEAFAGRRRAGAEEQLSELEQLYNATLPQSISPPDDSVRAWRGICVHELTCNRNRTFQAMFTSLRCTRLHCSGLEHWRYVDQMMQAASFIDAARLHFTLSVSAVARRRPPKPRRQR